MLSAVVTTGDVAAILRGLVSGEVCPVVIEIVAAGKSVADHGVRVVVEEKLNAPKIFDDAAFAMFHEHRGKRNEMDGMSIVPPARFAL
jgi:hypothetical protein